MKVKLGCISDSFVNIKIGYIDSILKFNKHCNY